VIDGISQPGKEVHPQTRKHHMFGAGPPAKRKRKKQAVSDDDTDSDDVPLGNYEESKIFMSSHPHI
jgi:hypothetical protein